MKQAGQGRVSTHDACLMKSLLIYAENLGEKPVPSESCLGQKWLNLSCVQSSALAAWEECDLSSEVPVHPEGTNDRRPSANLPPCSRHTSSSSTGDHSSHGNH